MTQLITDLTPIGITINSIDTTHIEVNTIGGPVGPIGPQGPPGPVGAPGPGGVPTGGAINQVLTKNSNADGDTGWRNPAVISVAGRTGVISLLEADIAGLVTDLASKYSATNIPPYPVTSVAGHTGAIVLSESDIPGLTGDLALKAPLSSPTFSGSVTVPDPVNATNAATKGYVDAVASGLNIKASVSVATTTALPASTYNNGSSGVGATLTGNAASVLTIDGQDIVLNDRILVKDESTATHNGIYICTTAGTVSVAYVLTRTSDMDLGSQVKGAFTFVVGGTINANSGFVVTGSGPFTIGTTDIVWTQFSGAGSIAAGSGITIVGNVISANDATSSVKGIIKLAGDLAGSATTPTVTNLHLSGDTSIGHKLTNLTNGSASSDAAAFGQIPTSAATIGGLLASSNLSDVGNAATAFGNIKQGATTTTTGVIKLAGDLGGSASLPLIKRTVSFTVGAHGYSGPADYICSGSSGNETEINQAIAAATLLSTGANVHLIGGAFSVSGDGITPASNVTMTCEAGVTIAHDNTAGSLTGIGSRPVFKNGTVDITDFGVDGLTLIGDTTSSSTSCAIYMNGDNDPDAPVGAPVITNFYMHNVRIRNCSSLPVRLFGLRGKLQTLGCEFTNSLDAGFGWNEEVIFVGNHSLNSHDNGWSISRGNRKVVCVGNTSENATFWGIWLSGFGNEDGPQYIVCNGNVVINPGLSAVALINSPRNYSCVGNVLDQNHNRPTSNSDCDVIQIRGASLNDRATDGVVSSNVCLNGARAGISYGWVDRLSIIDNVITNPGTQYKADGTTLISSTDTTTNVGILNLHVGACTGVYIDGNNITDNRTTPFMNYGMYKIGTSGVTYGINTVSGARNSNNQLSISQFASPGSPLTLTVTGPDANINTQFTNKGTGRFIIRGQSSPFELENTSGSTNSAISQLMSTGGVGSYIAGLTATRIDPFQNSRIAFRLLSNGSLGASDNNALFYMQGLAGHSKGFIGINGGVLFNRTAVADAAYTALVQDYIVGYSSLTAPHTTTLPSAVQLVGQTLIVKDEAGTAGTNNITISPFSLGSPSCTNADVDPSSDIFHLSTNIMTGTPVTLSTGGTLPSPLAPATTYYVTRNTLTLLNVLNEPGTLASDNSSGFVAWQNPGNATPADSVFATWTSDGNIDPSNPRGDTQTFSGSINASSTTLTAASSIFALTDEGKYVRIPGAGAAGADLITTIKTFVSATQVILSLAASMTVSGVTSAFGSTDFVISNYLKVTNFGFSIPTSAQIQGIVVKVKGKSTTIVGNQNLVYDSTAQLIKGGTVQGNNNAVGTQFTSSNNTTTYGSSSDMWGLSLTPSDINNSNFGFAFQVTSLLGTMNVDDINITVYYITPNDIQLATSLANALAGTQIDLTDSGSGTFTFSAPAQTIDGSSNIKINVNRGAVALYSDGSNWQVQGGVYNTSQLTALGGFANPMTTLGDIMYENGTPAAARLAGNTTTAKQYLSQTGTGSASAAPAWAAIAEADVTNLVSDLAAKAPLASPALTGTPTAPTPTSNDNSTKIATTAYVDSAIAGLDAKDPVAYASTSALPANTYNNGSSGVGATLTGNANGFLIIDGVTTGSSYTGLRVLIAGEATASHNGWYAITDPGSLITPYILTRTADSDQASEIESGYITAVSAPSGLTLGSSNNGKAFVSSAPNPFTVGTSSLTFSLIGAAYAAGNGLSLSGVTFAIDTSITLDKTTVQTLTNKRVTKRVETLTDAATVTPNLDNADGGKLTSLSQSTTMANPSGTPTAFQQYILRIKSSSAQSLTWDTQYRGSTSIALPSATTGSNKTDYFGFQWNSDDSKLDLIALTQGF